MIIFCNWLQSALAIIALRYKLTGTVITFRQDSISALLLFHYRGEAVGESNSNVTMPCPALHLSALPYLALSCLNLPCLTLLYPAMTCPALSCIVMSFLTRPYMIVYIMCHLAEMNACIKGIIPLGNGCFPFRIHTTVVSHLKRIKSLIARSFSLIWTTYSTTGEQALKKIIIIRFWLCA